jgi:hypothetical protein
MTARKSLTVLALAAIGVVAACSDVAREPAAPTPRFDMHGTCPTPAAVQQMIQNVVPSGGNRSSALAKFNQIVRSMERGNVADAQARALDLVDFLLSRYRSGAVGSITDPVKRVQMEALMDAILCTAGLPPMFGGSLGPDGVAVFILPDSPDLTVVTQTGFAGVHVPTGSVSQPTLVTITRLPDFPGPLLTQFDQFPLFYQYNSIPASSFLNDLTVGTCVATSANPNDPSRLRVAHNIPPFEMGSIEVLPLAAATFLDCEDADIASLPSGSRMLDLANSGTRLLIRTAMAVLLPQSAWARGSGLGGTTRTFSPFGAIDTLAKLIMDAPFTQFANPGDALTPPALILRTFNNAPMAGVPVTFTVTQGDGVLVGGGVVLTDANGRAAAESWTMGSTDTKVTATVATPPGTGIRGAPALFAAKRL